MSIDSSPDLHAVGLLVVGRNAGTADHGIRFDRSVGDLGMVVLGGAASSRPDRWPEECPAEGPGLRRPHVANISHLAEETE